MINADKHLLVVSIDAMVYEDLEYAKNLPNFKRILDGAAIIERVKTIYPTLTHPVHATIISGAVAGKTTVINNSIFNRTSPAGNDGVWYNNLSDIKCDTVFHAAKRAGYTVACSTWPLTLNGADVIDYLVPGILNVEFIGHEDDPLSVHRKFGAGENVIDIIAESVKRHGYKDVHPSISAHQTFALAEIIKKYKPNLMFTHPGYVDSCRHKSGVFSELVKESIRETDVWLGMLLQALETAEILEKTDIVLLSDHGQIGIVREVSPNVVFARKGYITLDTDNKLCDWKVYGKAAGAACHVYLKDPKDKALYDEVYEMLLEMAKDNVYGFEKVYTTEEVKEKYGFYGDFSFVLETDGFTKFGEHLSGPMAKVYDQKNYESGWGTHGHEPHKGPQPTFIGKGPSFKKGAVIKNGDILNHAPTFAKILGITLKDADGVSEDGILNI